MANEFYHLDPRFTDPKRLKKEREKARELKKTSWWLDQVKAGVCHYCQKKVASSELTMDHVVPLARGGTSTKGNLVASCLACNSSKKLETPVERILRELKSAKSTESAE